MRGVHVVSSKVIDNEEIVYKGHQLAPMFVYNKTQGTANIVFFRGPMTLDTSDMVDAEDVVNNDNIRSRDAINILAELPFVELVGGVALQRMMIRKITDVLQGAIPNIYWRIEGDDIKFRTSPIPVGVKPEYKKLSVSIATKSPASVLIHIGLNITAGPDAPSFAGSLTDMSDAYKQDAEIYNLMRNMADAITMELNDIYEASMKVLPK